MGGMSYPNALTKAYSALIPSDILSEPNNILATEYIRALIRSDSKIKAYDRQTSQSRLSRQKFVSKYRKCYKTS